MMTLRVSAHVEVVENTSELWVDFGSVSTNEMSK